MSGAGFGGAFVPGVNAQQEQQPAPTGGGTASEQRSSSVADQRQGGGSQNLESDHSKKRVGNNEDEEGYCEERGKKPGKKPVKMSAEDRKFQKEFMMMDVDNNGFIDKTDLSKICMGYVPESLISKAIAVVDTNRDGKITFAEYKTVRKLMGSIPRPSKFGKTTEGQQTGS